MYSINPHTDHPSEVLIHCARIAAVLRSWSQAMAASDAGSNLDPDDFDGITMLAGELEAKLKAAERLSSRSATASKSRAIPRRAGGPGP